MSAGLNILRVTVIQEFWFYHSYACQFLLKILFLFSKTRGYCMATVFERHSSVKHLAGGSDERIEAEVDELKAGFC